jgi:hypothetical protein
MFHRRMTVIFAACFAALIVVPGCDSTPSSGPAPVAHDGMGPQGKTPAAGPTSPLGKKEATKTTP